MKTSKYLQIAFLIVGVLVALEFIFVRGLFTWLAAVAAIIIVGALNAIVSLKKQDWLQAALYILSTVAFCMGYFVLA